MVEPDVSSCGPVNWMADVVDRPRIGVLPLVRDMYGSRVVQPERTAKLASRLLLEGDADSMFEHHQLERIDERTNDVGSLSVLHEARCRHSGLLRPQWRNRGDSQRCDHTQVSQPSVRHCSSLSDSLAHEMLQPVNVKKCPSGPCPRPKPGACLIASAT